MSFALVKFQAYPEVPAVPVSTTGYQYAYWELTAAATDLTLDFGTDSSTLYSDIGATQGGQDALAYMQAIAAQADSFLGVQSEQLFDRVPVRSLSAVSQMKLDVVNTRPKITCFTADGETRWKILMCWKLSKGNYGQVADIDAS